MSLAPGFRIGVYEVIAHIGSGGMGEVYRARDTRLERDVALKVLPDRVSTDQQTVSRFEREARTLATLSHPNIAVIHGLEEISDNGTLVYVPAAKVYALVLLQADRTERLLAEDRRSFENPRFSPDGQHVVVAATRRDGEPADLWLHAIATGTATRLTFDGGRAPVWTPDGSSVTYSHLGERGGIYSKRADGRGEASQVLALKAFHWLVGWTPDCRTLAYGTMEGTPSSIMLHSEGESRRIVGPGSTWGGRLSRDWRWLAYYTLDSGTFEVYVTPFPESGARWLIADGTDPTWSPDDTEVYDRSGSRLMAARIDKTEGIRALSHRLVLEPFLPPLYDDYDVHPDGLYAGASQASRRQTGGPRSHGRPQLVRRAPSCCSGIVRARSGSSRTPGDRMGDLPRRPVGSWA